MTRLLSLPSRSEPRPLSQRRIPIEDRPPPECLCRPSEERNWYFLHPECPVHTRACAICEGRIFEGYPLVACDCGASMDICQDCVYGASENSRMKAAQNWGHWCGYTDRNPDKQRIKELEQQLEEAQTAYREFIHAMRDAGKIELTG